MLSHLNLSMLEKGLRRFYKILRPPGGKDMKDMLASREIKRIDVDKFGKCVAI